MEKKQFLLCDGYYGRTNERSEQGFLFVLCGQFSFLWVLSKNAPTWMAPHQGETAQAPRA
ncbi:MAG TPA: hypothetical protein VLG93_04405 [Sulfuricaulis sp.]|nr:hypothetical protein [Sulfuricaulis sp.]